MKPTNVTSYFRDTYREKLLKGTEDSSGIWSCLRGHILMCLEVKAEKDGQTSPLFVKLLDFSDSKIHVLRISQKRFEEMFEIIKEHPRP